MVKTIRHPETGYTVAFGRNRPIARGPRLHLRNYAMQSLPAPPAAVDYRAAALTCLENILGNDTLGDCVPAGGFHVLGTVTGNAGHLITPTLDQVITVYSKVGGYVRGQPSTDNGCDEQTFLNFWQQKGLLPGFKVDGQMTGRHKITGWMAVDATNPVQTRTALWLFENLLFGMELPDAWISPFPSASGFVWDVAGDPDPQNGHCVAGVGYDTSGIFPDSWGLIGTITDAATAKYASQPDGGGELYTVLTPDIIDRAKLKAPNGFDWSQLLADFGRWQGLEL